MTPQRIKDEALKIFPTQMHSVQHGAFCDLNEYPRELWIAGATAENERAKGLVDFIQEIADSSCDYESTNFAKALHSPECRACKAAQILEKWKGEGER